MEAECAALEGELAEGRGALAALARRQAVAEKAIGEAKKEAARLGKDALLADKKAAKAEGAAADQQPAVDKAAEEATRVAKRLKAAEKSLIAANTEQRKSAEKVAKTRDKLADVEAAAREAAAAADAEVARGAFAPLTPALEAEYAAIKSEAAMRTHQITAEMGSEERAVATLRDVASAAAQKLAEVDARLAALAAHLVWLPSLWPETFSYTLSVAFASGHPVWAFDIGAIARRLRDIGREQALLSLDLQADPRAINDRVLAYRERCVARPRVVVA